MADNYLEKRYEEVFGRNQSSGRGPAAGRAVPAKPSLDKLLSLLSDCTEYDNSYEVHPVQMEAILGVLSRYPAPEGVRFEAVTKKNEGSSTFPEAYIIASLDNNRDIDIDTAVRLGAAIQNIRLKATEIGLSSTLYTRFDRESVKRTLGPASTPVSIIGIGKTLNTQNR